MRTLILVALLSACDNEKTEAPAAEATGANTMSADDLAGHAKVSGTVVETMDSGGYTYMLLNTANGQWWAAVQQSQVAVGQEVTLSNISVMHSFESKTLGRTFDQILFANLDSGEPAAATGGGAMAGAHGSMATTEAPAEIADVPRAEGDDGRTVAEIFAQKADLAGKAVAVRGQVVKYNPDIMGKNWVHLRDGSGSDAGGDNDLTVTTADAAAVGDVVVARGVVGTDRDLGAGYVYAVMMEDAKLEK